MKISAFRTIGIYMSSAIRSRADYRFTNVVSLFTSLIPYIIYLTVFWHVNIPGVLLYYCFSILVVKITQTGTLQTISEQIHYGRFSGYLLLPQSYLLAGIGEDLGNKLFDILSIIPFTVIAIIILHLHWQIDVIHIIGGVGSFLIGYIILYILTNTVALLSFFIQSIWYMFSLYYFAKNILTGAMFPIYLLPLAVRGIANYSPFVYAVYKPVQILTNQVQNGEIPSILIEGLIWVVVLYIIYTLCFSLSIKYYSANGG